MPPLDLKSHWIYMWLRGSYGAACKCKAFASDDVRGQFQYIKTVFPCMWISIIQIRQSYTWSRLILFMKIPIPGKTVLYPILVRSQNGPQHWNIATLLKLTHWENKCINIAHCQYHGCWCHEDARSHVIDNLGFELVCPEYYALSTGRVNPSLHESRRFPFVHHWLTPRTMYELRSIGRLCINAPRCICVFLSACINADIHPVYSVVYICIYPIKNPR